MQTLSEMGAENLQQLPVGGSIRQLGMMGDPSNPAIIYEIEQPVGAPAPIAPPTAQAPSIGHARHGQNGQLR